MVLAVALWMAHRVTSFFIEVPSAIGFDEGYTAAFGERLIEGSWLPYVDGVSHRGPLLYWATALSQLATERYSWLGLRWLSWALTLTTVLATFAFGAAARRPMCGAVAGLFYAVLICFGLWPGHGIAIHGEPVATPFLLFGGACVAFAVRDGRGDRARRAWLIAGGVLVGLAALGKQTMLPQLVPFALWVLAAPTGDASKHGWRPRLRSAGWLLLGWAAPLLVVVLVYTVTNHLGELWYWYVGYNAQVYMEPYGGADRLDSIYRFSTDFQSLLMPLATAVLIIAAARTASRLVAGRGESWAARFHGHGFEAVIALQGWLAFLAALAPLRFFEHYFVPVLPWFGLLLGLSAESAVRGVEGLRRRVGLGVLTASLALLGLVLTSKRVDDLEVQRLRGQWQAMTPEPICKAIDNHSKPDDPIFIWGFDGDLYITCKRKPASRFVYLTLVAGIVPPLWHDPRPERVAKHSRENLLADLKASQPPVILDIPLRLGGFSMQRVPELKSLLVSDYCRHTTVMGKNGRTARLWVTKKNGPCPELPTEKVELQQGQDLFLKQLLQGKGAEMNAWKDMQETSDAGTPAPDASASDAGTSPDAP